jgi:hypothetical protein
MVTSTTGATLHTSSSPPPRGDLAVGGRVARRDAEPPAEVGEEVEAPVHAARHARADADDVAPRRGEAEFRVVGRDAVDLAPRDVEVRGDGRQVLRGEPAAIGLDGLERREEPRPLRRERGEQLVDRSRAHRRATSG